MVVLKDKGRIVINLFLVAVLAVTKRARTTGIGFPGRTVLKDFSGILRGIRRELFTFLGVV